jgi:hypothetical protein
VKKEVRWFNIIIVQGKGLLEWLIVASGRKAPASLLSFIGILKSARPDAGSAPVR